MSKKHKSVVRNQGYVRAVVENIEKHNERKNENYSNTDVIPEQSGNNIHFKVCSGTYLGVFDKMVKDGEISTRGLKLNNEGTKPESNIIEEMVFDVNTEYFESHYKDHGYNNGYEFAKAFYTETYKMAVKEVGDEKYILSAVIHADERNEGLSKELGRDVYHYHLHVVYIAVTPTEILWTKRCKDPALVGTVKEVINKVGHHGKWGCEMEVGEDGKKRLNKSYSKLQDSYHDHMKAAGFTGFERGKEGSTAKNLSVTEYKTKLREEELADKSGKLELINIEFDETQAEIENARAENARLQVERDALEKEVARIKELQKLKTKTQKIEIPDKPLIGNTKIPHEDLLKLKEMADAYIANENEIKEIRKRRVVVSKRETTVTEKDKDLTAREKILVGKENLIKNATNVKTERDNLKIKLGELEKENSILKNDKQFLAEKLESAHIAMRHIIQAIGLLKYDFEYSPDYKIENLSPKQSIMINALANYGARLAEKNNFIEQAEAMRNNIALDVEVKNEMRKLNPNIFNKQQKSREYYR